MLGNFWKLYAGKFCDPYEGNLLMEAMCWEIRVDAGGFLRGVWHNATASHYGFKATVPGAEFTIPAAQTFLERSEAKTLLEVSKVMGSVEQGDGDAQPMLVNSEAPVGKRDSYEVNQKALA